MQFLTDENELIFSNYTALYFYASWMPNHHRIVDMISKIEEKYSDLKFLAIDTDYFSGFCRRFKVKSIPTTIIFVNQEEKDRIEGYVLTSAFKKAFSDIFNIKEIQDGKIIK